MLASFCGNCGHPFQQNEMFCAKCGTLRDTDTSDDATSFVSAPSALSSEASTVLTTFPLKETKEQCLNRGNTHFDAKRYQEALEVYRQCLSIDPTYIGAYGNIILALRRLKRFDEMLETCEKALQIKPDDVFIVHSRGDALWDLGRYEEALTAYDQALRLDPTYPYSYHNKSIILDHLGRKEEAREASIQARKHFKVKKSIPKRLRHLFKS